MASDTALTLVGNDFHPKGIHAYIEFVFYINQADDLAFRRVLKEGPGHEGGKRFQALPSPPTAEPASHNGPSARSADTAVTAREGLCGSVFHLVKQMRKMIPPQRMLWCLHALSTPPIGLSVNYTFIVVRQFGTVMSATGNLLPRIP